MTPRSPPAARERLGSSRNPARARSACAAQTCPLRPTGAPASEDRDRGVTSDHTLSHSSQAHTTRSRHIPFGNRFQPVSPPPHLHGHRPPTGVPTPTLEALHLSRPTQEPVLSPAATASPANVAQTTPSRPPPAPAMASFSLRGKVQATVWLYILAPAAPVLTLPCRAKHTSSPGSAQ